MSRVDLQTLEEARVAYAALYDEHEISKATIEEMTVAASAKDEEIATLKAQNHALFLRIPMVDNTEVTETEEEKSQSAEDYAHSISKEFYRGLINGKNKC
jgi:hypothetical protein